MSQQPTEYQQRGMDWWNARSEAARRYWCEQAGSARPADAYAEFRRRHDTDPVAAELDEAFAVAEAITGTRPKNQ